MRVREGRKERREYFYDLLNFRDDLEAELSCPWRGGLENERRRERDNIFEEEAMKVLKKVKRGKSTGLLDGDAVN